MKHGATARVAGAAAVTGGGRAGAPGRSGAAPEQGPAARQGDEEEPARDPGGEADEGEVVEARSDAGRRQRAAQERELLRGA